MLNTSARNSFSARVSQAHRFGQLVVQPRMGFSDPRTMRAGLLAVERASATTVGTVTLDSYTRLGQHTKARRALARGVALNGYPIVAHGPEVNRSMLAGLHGPDFPVQVRHGSASPRDIFAAMIDVGLDATEGGPVSYCLPYGRTPLRDSVRNWAESCELLLTVRDRGSEPHLETFGGCMMGQLCPPGLLVAISLLEGLFFRQHGITSISLSYAQQTNADQDAQAVHALRHLAARLLPDIDWHVVVYTYMGLHPRTRSGAQSLLRESARLAVRTGAVRLIVKTVSEAFRIPTVAENVEALETASRAAREARPGPIRFGDEVLAEASTLVERVLDLNDDIGVALIKAFARGYLDVPYCLHPDNRGLSRGYIDGDGWLRWSRVGAMPVAPATGATHRELSSDGLIAALELVQRRFDRPANPEGADAIAGSHGVEPS